MIKQRKGFTLIEILLVIAAISILAAIVIVAINPAKQLAEARNAQRRSNVNTILNAVHQYAIDNNGTLPTIPQVACAATPTTTQEICKLTATGTCADGVSLAVLTTDEKYLVSMPIDPSVSSADGTGYHITKSANGRVTVCAPSTETTWMATPADVSVSR